MKQVFPMILWGGDEYFWNGAFNLTQKDNGMKQERVLGEKHSSTN